MLPPQHIIMIASENDALKSGKVGGLGDVVRDLPAALAQLGFRITTIIPAYGFLHRENPSKQIGEILFPFAGEKQHAELWEVTLKSSREGIRHLVVEHPEIRGEPIYSNDPPGHAFVRDATKYALFCSAVGQFLKTIPDPFVLHLHDWHTGFLFLLRELHAEFTHLKKHKTVFTIHNLAIQGTRPMQGDHSSVEQWFPELFEARSWIIRWKDPNHEDPSFTPMAAGIQHADKVNTVSPTYAEEILRHSDHALGFFGGEGLESLLQRTRMEGRLFGILNGAEYPPDRTPPKMRFPEMCDLIVREVTEAKKTKSDPLFDGILARMQKLRKSDPRLILTSVTRVVEQKIKILHENNSVGNNVMDEILIRLAAKNGIYLFIGTGTTDYEEKLIVTFHKHVNFVFLKLFSQAIAEALYANGNIFMMPSSFEPCGIGQMIAMRDGQPCVVHATGGLRDTVVDGVNGFQFAGETLIEKADNCITATERAMNMAVGNPTQWQSVCSKAREMRFTWEKSAKQYIEHLYA